ncbi:serine/threonine/tyrosine-interacting-like protein 1 isoform X2 [Halichondria panicea]|uniref:serine/threonine/tyrosine-interacting-like protein 1 isoform X2 n=1 Tax=Halichondria panicea TaxID=6063 RepID=UPI00312BBCAF
MMSSSSAGIALCEPTQLYNILTQCTKNPAVLSQTYLTLFDARDVADYNEAHVVISKASKYTVMILKGGYERFSAEYPFLRTQKIMYTDIELLSLPRYPSEILPLFLYLGDRHHAYNASLNYDLKIHVHLSLGSKLYPAFPEGVTELHLDVDDQPDQDLLSKFEEIYEFLETQRKKSDRVLVFSELGISRGATVIIAYLMKRQKWSLKEAFCHVQKCRHHIRPLTCFLEQLSQWETQVLGELITDIHKLYS